MDFERQKEIWADFIYDGKIDESLCPEIAESWRRCRAWGVNPSGGRGKCADGAVFNSIYKANRHLLDIALPVMKNVFEVLDKSHYLLVLTDSAGYILETMGDVDINRKSEDLHFRKGCLWNSMEVGTNAISVALEFNKPTQMAGAEHYCRSHHPWTCSAAPIHGVDGELIGCINFSGYAETVHSHTLALAIAAADSIEAQLKEQHHAELMRSALDAASDAIFLLNSDLKPFWENSAAKKLTGMNEASLSQLDFKAVLPNIPWTPGRDYFTDDTIVLLGERGFYCGADIRNITQFGSPAVSVTLRKQKHLINAVNRLSRNKAVFSFEDFNCRSAAMQKALALARRFSDYDGNILIEGESGTRLELVAQAIHNASANSRGPFVTISCSTIHRDTLEADLFGVEVGAYGGKITESSPGRFELAQNGTLFLEEVSELPMEFQTKLLNVVENRSLRRIGGNRDISLNIRIIASSSCKLDDMINEGTFRADLYHMLNILKINVPSLRERKEDIEGYARQMLSKLNETSPDIKKTMDKAFISGLENGDWPGNIRQLQNSIERAFYSETGDVLSESSLSFALEKPEHDCEASPSESPEDGEKRLILAALELSYGDVEAASKRLGTSRATLYRKLKTYGINPKKMKK